MILKKIEKILSGRFIHRYNITYETVDHRKKVYEMISRDDNIQTKEDLSRRSADGVVMMVHDEANEKIVLNREYRLSIGQEVYSFPAGLIDKGETPVIAAKRELKEETGLTLIKVVETLAESYSAVGFSNEKNICMEVIAKGEFSPSSSTMEEIEAAWYTKEEVRHLLKTQMFAGRTQVYCYLWSKE